MELFGYPVKIAENNSKPVEVTFGSLDDVPLIQCSIKTSNGEVVFEGWLSKNEYDLLVAKHGAVK